MRTVDFTPHVELAARRRKGEHRRTTNGASPDTGTQGGPCAAIPFGDVDRVITTSYVEMAAGKYLSPDTARE